MALTPFTIERFGGLNLADDPLEVGASGAVDLQDVDFDQSGKVRSRDGTTLVKSLTISAVNGFATFENSAGDRQFIAGYTVTGTPKYEAYASTGGSAVATQTVGGAAISAARMGTVGAGQEYLFLANGVDTVWRWFSGAFAQPAGMPIATYLTVAQTSNRLVAGSIVGTSTSRVWFSDPGAPSTFGASNYVELTPGDGSDITGLTSWQNLVFTFKRGRFFVFTGESPDADGAPIFNYRTIDGYGSIVPPVAGDEGVYFFDGRTVWVTSGDVPRRVSRNVEPFIRGLASVNSVTADQTTLSQARLFYTLGRLYLSIKSATSGWRVLVYDAKVDAWTLYTNTSRFLGALRVAATDRESVYYLDQLGAVYRFDPTVAAETWSYKSGKYSLADPGHVAVTNEASLIGSGSVTLRLDSDLYSNQSASATLGTAPAIAEGWPSPADQEGEWLQYTLSGSGAASVSRLKHFVNFVKPAGIV